MTQNIMGASSALPQVLVSQQLAAAETTQYQCPTSTSVKIANAVLSNPTSSAVTVYLSLVKSGVTAGAANRVVAGYSLAANDSTVITELQGHVLGPGDFVSALAATASAVVFVMSATVFS